MFTFKKYQCFGRDFILIDNRDAALSTLQEVDLARLCERRFGIGASGILMISGVSQNLIEVNACNFNGIAAPPNLADAACVAAFANDLNIPFENISINGHAVHCKITSHHERLYFVTVRVIEPLSIKKMFQNFTMDFAETPYLMVPVDDVAGVNILEEGRNLAHSKRFPIGANIVFYQPGHTHLHVRHYEYPTDEETYTNGICVIGATLSHAQNSTENHYFVRTKGGEMQISFARSEQAFYNIELQVLVNSIYSGNYN